MPMNLLLAERVICVLKIVLRNPQSMDTKGLVEARLAERAVQELVSRMRSWLVFAHQELDDVSIIFCFSICLSTKSGSPP